MTSSASPDEFWDFLDHLVSEHKIVIDRPKGSTHPRYPGVVYPLDYGYLEGTTSGDGGGIDIWQGTDISTTAQGIRKSHISALFLTIDLNKNDVEIKIALDCTDEELQTILSFHNGNKMRATLFRKPS